MNAYCISVHCAIHVHSHTVWYKCSVTCLLITHVLYCLINIQDGTLSHPHYNKELSLCHKLWFSNPYIFGPQCRKPLMFHTYFIWSNRSHSLKCQRSTTLGCKDIGKGKSEFVAKTQFNCPSLLSTWFNILGVFKVVNRF